MQRHGSIIAGERDERERERRKERREKERGKRMEVHRLMGQGHTPASRVRSGGWRRLDPLLDRELRGVPVGERG